MAAPRVTIDQLPDKPTAAGSDLLVIQDGTVTKKVTMQHVWDGTGLAAHVGNATGAHAATAISAASNGTGQDGANVQVQLGQIKVTNDAQATTITNNTNALNNHLSSTSAHSAVNITADASGRTYFTGTNLDTQLDAGDAALTTTNGNVTTNATNLTNHTSQAAGAHAATAVSITAVSGLSSNQVQGAIGELAAKSVPVGGATNQFLAKKSATANDVQWVTVAPTVVSGTTPVAADYGLAVLVAGLVWISTAGATTVKVYNGTSFV